MLFSYYVKLVIFYEKHTISIFFSLERDYVQVQESISKKR
ncbi:hypothetical protein HNP69_000889 [Chryseobacterium koreense]|nr:hypothetical protein [Chryseobacterium koreense]